VRANPGKAAAVAVLLGLIGFGVYLASFSVLGWHYRKAGKKALDMGNYPLAREEFERCLRYSSGNGQVHYWLARTYRNLGEFDRAHEQLEACERLGWSPEGIDLERTLLDAQQGKFAELEDQLKDWARRDNEDTAAVLEVLAMHYAGSYKLAAALHWGEKFLKHAPNNVNAILGMAMLSEQSYDVANSLKYFRRAAQVDPDNDSVRQALAEALLRFKEYRQALEEFERLRPRHSDSPSILLGVARCYRGLGELDKGLPLLEQLAAEHPQSPEILSERGIFAWKAGHKAEAEKWFKRSLKYYPHDTDTLYKLALCLQQQGPKKQREADKYFARKRKVSDDIKRLDELMRLRLAQQPNNVDNYYEVGKLCLKYGQEEKGLYWLQKALSLRPTHTGAHKELAKYYQRKGYKDLAKKHQTLAAGRVYAEE
jgi:tetratricopeptide (TPR) repeat protein